MSMTSEFLDRCGIEFPLFAFSHCRDVVIAVSRAGGMGVLGTARSTPDQVATDLGEIEGALRGKPYGVDLLLPGSDRQEQIEEVAKQVPQGYRDFVEGVLRKFGVPPGLGTMSVEQRVAGVVGGKATVAQALKIVDVALAHEVRVFASALGAPGNGFVDAVHEKGALMLGMAGSVVHARKHVEAGADVVVAQGTEAGGHTGEVGTMVLVPDVVDAVAPVPVLAAGGIADGRQIAAALALGAAGVWTGSVWLTTTESDLDPAVKEKLIVATARDAIRSRAMTGKPARQLRTAWIDAWEGPDAPPPLRMPLQGVLVEEAQMRIAQHHVTELMGTPVGQVVGRLSSVRPAARVVQELMEGAGDAAGKLAGWAKGG